MHTVEIKTTNTGWHYAKCSCGWRSRIAYPPQQSDAAKASGDAHLREAAS